MGASVGISSLLILKVFLVFGKFFQHLVIPLVDSGGYKCPIFEFKFFEVP